MLKKADTSITDTLAVFNLYNLDIAFLVPTETGMQKALMDATATVRNYFHDMGFHDYEAQPQGQEAKIMKDAVFVRPDGVEPTTASLYRPVTKSGDPRIWFGKLNRYAEPYNLLAIFVHDDSVYIVNCSDPLILASIHDPATPLGAVAAGSRQQVTDPVVDELLDMIRELSEKGFIRTLRPGNTGVGMTLESMLGIAANTSQAPDYKGIELKAKRLRKNQPNRVTLFSQVPNWKLSPIRTAWNLLSTYGYMKDGKLRLYHEIDATAPNSIGFFLEVDIVRDWLKQNYRNPEATVTRHVTTWEMEKLRKRLEVKHRQTFWVGANCRGRGANEEFHYVKVEHTKQPKVRNLDALIESGIISVDYLMSQRASGGVRDHGYLFKIHSSNFPALFPPSDFYDFA